MHIPSVCGSRRQICLYSPSQLLQACRVTVPVLLLAHSAIPLFFLVFSFTDLSTTTHCRCHLKQALKHVPKSVLSFLGNFLMLKTLLPEQGFPTGEQFLHIWTATLYCSHHYWQQLWSLPQTSWLAKLEGAFWSSFNNIDVVQHICLLLFRGEGHTLAIRAWKWWFR